MKKQIIIIGITLLLLAVGFSGCTSEQEGAKTEIGDEDQLNGDQSVEGKIAYVSDGNIHVINPDGINEVRLTWGYKPVWSPDGKKIAFVNDFPYGNDLYVINSDGTGVIKIANFSYAFSEYCWSPDSKKILFKLCGFEGGGNVYIINIDSSDLIKLADWGSSATFSPDGKKIVFSVDESVYIISVDGSGLTKLAEGFWPQWSPS